MSVIQERIKRNIDRFRNIARGSGKNPLSALLYINRLQRSRGFYLTEIHDCELDRHDKAYEESFLNWEEQKRYLDLLNPRKYYSLARNKYLTHLVLEAAGVTETAELLCYYNPEAGLGTGRIGTDATQVRAILQKSGYDRFIIKTTESSHGDNVWVIEGVEYTAGDAILRRYDGREMTLSSVLGKEPLIFESLIEQTPQMMALNPSSVNTVRFMTTLMPDGTARTIATFIKIGRAGSCVDNAGAGGNVDAAVDVRTGRLYNAISFNGWRKITPIQNHPDTGCRVEGMVIENWEEIKRRVEDFQRRLPYVKAAGWDIAITPRGPVVIEVNDMWDRTGQLFLGRGWKREIEECYFAWKEYHKSR
ncbi:MAG: hypothetical protein K2O24_00730 [Muribaculaceae bacterium]|nr:hypothetical protein [Muribaculaceae bacterium]